MFLKYFESLKYLIIHKMSELQKEKNKNAWPEIEVTKVTNIPSIFISISYCC